MSMTPQAAGAALAADPTFNLMSRDEQEAEAALLLGELGAPSDDPLDVALAIEIAEAGEFVDALTAERVAVAELAAGIEPCRLETPCTGREPVAGNGRCMSCGAQRAVAAVEPVVIVQATPAPTKPETRRSIAPAVVQQPATLRHGVTYDPGVSFIGRFKEATGATDRELSGMLGMSRATSQAYAGGRLAEKLDDKQLQTLADDLAERLLLLANLKRDLAVALGEAN